jgi:hypothetical protein
MKKKIHSTLKNRNMFEQFALSFYKLLDSAWKQSRTVYNMECLVRKLRRKVSTDEIEATKQLRS